MRNGYIDFGLGGLFITILIVIAVLGLFSISSIPAVMNNEENDIKYVEYKVDGKTYVCQKGLFFNTKEKTCYIEAKKISSAKN